MFNKIAQIFLKIKLYMEYHGLKETIHRLFSRVSAKLKKKFGGPEGISAATPRSIRRSGKVGASSR